MDVQLLRVRNASTLQSLFEKMMLSSSARAVAFGGASRPALTIEKYEDLRSQKRTLLIEIGERDIRDGLVRAHWYV